MSLSYEQIDPEDLIDTNYSESYEIVDLPTSTDPTRTDPIVTNLDINNNIDIPGIKVDESDFDKLLCIGKGGFAKVFQVRKNSGKDIGTYYAMKVVKKRTVLKTQKDTIHQKTERHVLESARHPFLIEMKYAFQTNDRLYMILEFAPGGELYNLLEQNHIFTEQWAAFYLAEISVGLGYLHGIGVIYRDLKPENILIDANGHVKLTDFGLAKLVEREKDGSFGLTNTFCGTVEYMAPEVIVGSGHSKEVDWWTLGNLMYDMLEGRPPFQGQNREETMRLIKSGKLKLNKDSSREAHSLIINLLQRDYKKRLGYGERDVEDVLNHDFFKYFGLNDKKTIESLDVPFIPWLPNIANIADAPYVEKQFKGMTLAGSPPDNISETFKETFHGFSYPNNFNLQQEEISLGAAGELGSSPLVRLTCR